MLEVHRTHRAKILNHAQVEESLDRHGWSASKLWNVANYHSREVWEETGEIPDHGDLKAELKAHPTYRGLHSQSSQRVLEELAEAFNSWYGKRKSDSRANPPGYRKKHYYDDHGNRVHEEHPRSTVTWKQNGIRYDTKNNRVRLSKGANHKDHPKAWEYILVEYETRPGVTIETLQQVRAVYDPEREENVHDDAFLAEMDRVTQEVAGTEYRPWMIYEDGRPWPREDWELASSYRALIEQHPHAFQWSPITFAHNTPATEPDPHE